MARQLAGRPAAPEKEIEAEDEGRAVRLFLALGTQWIWAAAPIVGTAVALAGGYPVRMGLRYEALPVVAGALALTLDADLLADLQTIEAEALKALAEARR